MKITQKILDKLTALNDVDSLPFVLFILQITTVVIIIAIHMTYQNALGIKLRDAQELPKA